jgi:organic hydroperoxide reductase OsmC/OhrA
VKRPIAGPSEPAFRDDAAWWNLEDLLLASIFACYKPRYIRLCPNAGIVVVSYRDQAEATMVEEPNGAGRFVSAVSRPTITIKAGGDLVIARHLHQDIREYCFIADSVNFPMSREVIITSS